MKLSLSKKKTPNVCLVGEFLSALIASMSCIVDFTFLPVEWVGLSFWKDDEIDEYRAKDGAMRIIASFSIANNCFRWM